MTYEYTGGREGTHSITLAKPVGGGFIDIEHVPLDQVELYATNGYYPIDSDGTYPYTGYCMSQPTDADHTLEADCEPASVTPVLFTQTANPAQPMPATLPAVGSKFETVLIIEVGLILSIIAAVVAYKIIGRHR